METTDLVKAEDAQLAEDREVTVVAATATQMAKAQEILVARMAARIVRSKAEVEDLDKNLKIAVANKLRQATIIAALNKAQRRVYFYEKLHAALKEGYTIIPEMDVDIFAVRTTRKRPSGGSYNTRYAERVPDQETTTPPLGTGRYVDVRPTVRGSENKSHDKAGAEITLYTRFADEFQDVIDFPFALAKPQILEATADALRLGIFDEIGVLPQSRRADPMVVGNVVFKNGSATRRVSFLICWFIETSTL